MPTSPMISIDTLLSPGLSPNGPLHCQAASAAARVVASPTAASSAGAWRIVERVMSAPPRRIVRLRVSSRLSFLVSPRPATSSGVDQAVFADWCRRNRQRSRALFDLLDDEAYYSQPIALRPPSVFYEGHLPALSFHTLIERELGRSG